MYGSRVDWHRTIPRFSEAIYAFLGTLFIGIGAALIIAGSITGFVVAIIAGVIFLFVSIHEYRRLLLQTASKLSLDPTTGILSWRATFGHGEVSVETIEKIGRNKQRPEVYEISCSDGTRVNFWLSSRSRALTTLFEQLERANPTIDTSDLFTRHRLWWRGLKR